MKVFSTYKVKIKHFNHIFMNTVEIYRKAVDFLIPVCDENWDFIISGKRAVNLVEKLVHKTKDNPMPKYDFDTKFYKLPSYMRRSAISEAIGKVSSYRSNLANWDDNGKPPSVPKAGFVFPAMYREEQFKRTGEYEAKLKVFIRNTWDWITVKLRKSDVDYISNHCKDRKECAPTLQKRGKEWFLDFPFEENVALNQSELVVAVDLGINCAATVSVMNKEGTILGRHFCHLPKEIDSLNHSINWIKKAQQNGNRRTPRLWAKVKGINKDISVKTSDFIIEVAKQYHTDVIVFEHLDRNGKVHGSKKQKIRLWRSQEVQAIVTNKAHRNGIHVSTVNAWCTSKLAYDGSGTVTRGINGNYSVCQFMNGKTYNCDLSASYNIGARYIIREKLKSLSETSRLLIEAKVPQCSKRSTCTLSTLISLNAVLL